MLAEVVDRGEGEREREGKNNENYNYTHTHINNKYISYTAVGAGLRNKRF